MCVVCVFGLCMSAPRTLLTSVRCAVIWTMLNKLHNFYMAAAVSVVDIIKVCHRATLL